MRLPVYERVVLHREILKSLESPERVQTDVRLNRLAEVMQSVSGLDVRERSRKTDIVRARVVFVFVARAEGFTQSAIANFLKLDCSKLKSTFGWTPRWNLDEAMDKIVEWSKIWLAGGDVRECMDKQIAEFLNK